MAEKTKLDKYTSREMLPALSTLILAGIGLATGKVDFLDAILAVLGGTGLSGGLVLAPKLFNRDQQEK